MLDSVSTSSNSTKTLLQQKIDDFNDGKVNISKSDLKQYVEEKKAAGEKVSEEVQDIIDSYEKIDLNDDGISIKELSTYNIKKAVLENFSIKKDTLLNYINTSGNMSSSATSGLSSYAQSLLDSYSSSNETKSYSLLDYMT